MELQSGESQFPAVGSKLRFEGSDEDQKQIICKLRSSVFVLEIICLFFIIIITRLVVTCSLSLVVGDTDDTETAQMFLRCNFGICESWLSKIHQCTQYNQYSALLSSPFQIFIAAAKCRVVPPAPPRNLPNPIQMPC